MTPTEELDTTEVCATCGQRPWPGDRFCRSCGQAGLSTGSDVMEIDFENGESTGGLGSRKPMWRRWLAIFALAVGVAAIIALLMRSDDDTGPPGETEDSTSVNDRFEALPESMQRADDPPERQAALNAFETERERALAAAEEMYAQLSPTSEVLFLVGDDLYRWHPLDDGLTESPVSASGASSARAWSPLGPAEISPWRIENRARLFLEHWDDASRKWAASKIGASLPISTVAVSTTHVATETGGLVRFWSQATQEPTADTTGRLLPSTGPGFLVSICEPECEVRLFDHDGSELPRHIALDAATYSPSLERPARISPDASSVAFVDGDRYAFWRPGEQPAGEVTSPLTVVDSFTRVIDVAWLPESSGLLMLTPNGVSFVSGQGGLAPVVGLTVRDAGGNVLNGGWSGFGLID